MAQKHQQFSLARMKYDPLTIYCSGVLRPGSIQSRSDVFIPQTTLNGQKTWIKVKLLWEIWLFSGN
jgi:hypothetical protein